MEPKLVCAKCDECDFLAINDLEKHIVKQHFSSVNALYRCWFTRCQVQFATEVDRLKHVHYKKHNSNPKMLMQMQAEDFVSLRLAINKCLNESITLSFAGCTQSQRNCEGIVKKLKRTLNNENEPSKAQGLATPAPKEPAPKKEKKKEPSPNLVINIDNLFKSDAVTRSTTAKMSYKLKKSSIKYSVLNDARNKRNDRENSQRTCAEKVGPRLSSVSVTAGPALSNGEPIERNNGMIERESSSSPSAVKDEPSLFDELAATISFSSNHRDKLILRDSEPTAPKPADPKMGNLSDRNNAHKRAENETLVLVKDEPSLFDELAARIPVSSNFNGSLKPLNTESTMLSLPPERSRMETVSVLHEENDKRSECANSSKLFAVKDEPNDGLSAPVHVPLCGIPVPLNGFPAPLNNCDPSTPLNIESAAPLQKPKRSRKQDFADLDPEDLEITQLGISSEPSLFKNEPSLIDELAANIPGPSNYDDNLTPSNIDLPPSETKPRQDRRQTTTSVRRAVVMANAEGLNKVKISRIFDISEKTVRSILKRWMTEGTVEKAQRKPRKRPRICSEAIEQFIVNLVKEDPFKSPMVVRAEVFKKFNQTISYRTASKVLKRHNSFKVITQKDLSQPKPS
ncbi:winged helix-turn helix domain-containing protein [Ditylenchus destructor]|uniref:Winged helix-turn helix domain-containing protein n=1 Tax=Ditylenchus destructor TaxID=166010 RepID=A0AAD4QUU0_9BILA|nr:winged helix-turn helix domain-containing protein [Ditylenchus destructor]